MNSLGFNTVGMYEEVTFFLCSCMLIVWRFVRFMMRSLGCMGRKIRWILMRILEICIVIFLILMVSRVSANTSILLSKKIRIL